ncbi:MFS transporter [Endozoicomonas euniceicola]|uniref:MFS transporter n=1 Tax=Endozoicomonas euniceicola TaxID=1234143 RepID=A0ABY6H1D1_9GAMM|nr:MFS transporter [Endozoicomonas euniceicola]UYM18720.1 MFS transporter [Endozoicomonas euniceicola]
MARCRQFILLLIVFLISGSLYSPQPVFPYLSDYFHSNPAQTSELVTRIMLVLCFGAFMSGLLLRAISARMILLVCFPLLGGMEILFSSVEHIEHALVLKTIEGILFSAILPALLTALADTSDKAGDAVVWYVSASVTGSMCGRFLSGSLISAGYHSPVWIAIGSVMLVISPFILLLDRVSGNSGNIQLKTALAEVLGRKDVWACVLLIFTAICCLASILNYLPFHMRSRHPDMSAAQIATLYTGYICAIISSILTPRARRCVGNDRFLFRLTLFSLLLGMTILVVDDYGSCLVAVAIICGAVFMLHSGLSTYLNQHVSEHRRVVNGVYLASYYLGGAFSSMLPGSLFMSMGWLWLLGGLFILLCVAIAVVNLIEC